jgi:hypothetical protein
MNAASSSWCSAGDDPACHSRSPRDGGASRGGAGRAVPAAAAPPPPGRPRPGDPPADRRASTTRTRTASAPQATKPNRRSMPAPYARGATAGGGDVRRAARVARYPRSSIAGDLGRGVVEPGQLGPGGLGGVHGPTGRRRVEEELAQRDDLDVAVGATRGQEQAEPPRSSRSWAAGCGRCVPSWASRDRRRVAARSPLPTLGPPGRLHRPRTERGPRRPAPVWPRASGTMAAEGGHRWR